MTFCEYDPAFDAEVQDLEEEGTMSVEHKNCLEETAKSAGMGALFGTVAGAAIANWGDVPKVIRNKSLPALKETGECITPACHTSCGRYLSVVHTLHIMAFQALNQLELETLNVLKDASSPGSGVSQIGLDSFSAPSMKHFSRGCL